MSKDNSMTYAELQAFRVKLNKKKEHLQMLLGRRDQLIDQLKVQFDCDSIEDAKSKLKKEETKEQKLVLGLERKVQLFNKKYKELLEV